MIVLLYFDWIGSRKELNEWNERVKEHCKDHEVNFMGIYFSMNEKWNYVSMFDTETFEKFLNLGKKVGRAPQMSHYITEILMPQKLV